MTKAPISLQDLRRRIYVKAKTEPPGVSGDYTSISARGKRLAKRTRWRKTTTVLPE